MSKFECPSCDAGFDTHRGLGVHHSHTHGTRLPNRTCSQCGDEFYSDYAKKYCSDSCLQESDSYAGPNNPNYKGGRETTQCIICGAEFEFYPSEKEGLYCSDCVQNETWQHVPEPATGPGHPHWNGGKVELTCPICGETFERYPGMVHEGTNLCSNDCRAKWLSEAFTGEGHPNWKGGGNEPYGTGWNEIRERALERDDFTCVVCGTAKEALGRNPDVHHIVPVRTFIESDRHTKAEAHTLDNVVTLCVTCHRRADVGTIPAVELRSLIVDATRPSSD